MSRSYLGPSLALLALAAATTLLAVTQPWTIVPIEPVEHGSASSAGFEAGAYVKSIWASKVLLEAKASALDLRQALLDGSRTPRFVRGEGLVVRVDLASRVGRALIDLSPDDGQADVALQVGPVIRGTALRDALSFVSFSDFANQLEFADVGHALNAQVIASVVDGDTTKLEGRRLVFWGATRLEAGSGDRIPEIVPVILQQGQMP